ncbi:MAG: hypothetical protein M1835_004972 [Candelina submexicana]|nr:MAG: hypothetical protein M1835_004972 [Candelina submexicana]
MEPPRRPSANSLFQVYLRLRPPPTTTTGQSAANPQPIFPQLYSAERYLTVEEPSSESEDGVPTLITIRPPSESRKRAVEKFAFTKVFEEDAAQLDIFSGTGIIPLIQGVLGPDGKDGRDGLLATLGVTGSGKSHTILGSKTQRGLTQLSLDVLYRSLGDRLLHPTTTSSVSPSLSVADASESHLIPATVFLDTLYGDPQAERISSRATTPITVGGDLSFHPSSLGLYPAVLGLSTGSSPRGKDLGTAGHFSNTPRLTRSIAKQKLGAIKEGVSTLSIPRRQLPPRPSALPVLPDVDNIEVAVDKDAEYAVMISMYEVYNDRIYDLLTGQGTTAMSSKNGTGKDLRRRPLLFKSTEHSPDRKVVAGLRKVICGNLEEALMILETGLMERRVAGTGSNSVSSRSHGFFCIEVKKRNKHIMGPWVGSNMTIVDLAGSERARNAKTVGTTLAEAGKINESLMYLGQCLQMQSDSHDGNKAPIVPFRQCKLTELLFSNSFPSVSSNSHQHTSTHRNPQKAIMIVTADPVGDFNATSQILRYSALAREVTVPRIPSVTSTILSGTTAKSHLPSGRTTPSFISFEDLELAAQEIARLSEALDVIQVQLAEEEKRRREAEAAWKEAEERCVSIEQDVREECWSEMEGRIEDERRRWRSAWDEEAIHEDDPTCIQDDRASELEDENAKLRRKVDQLERELQGRSPTKKKKQITVSIHEGYQDVENTVIKLNRTNLEEKPPMMRSPQQTPAKTPGKKQRKLTTRKWDLGMDFESP